MIVIVDYGVGNTGSIMNMLRKIGVKAVLTSDLSAIKNADKLILPGVGSFDAGMTALNARGQSKAIKEAVQKNIPILGICLGMQLLTEGSEEGEVSGLALVPGRCLKLDSKELEIKVPHMGWNNVFPEKGSDLFDHTEKELRYYFVHSYYVVCDDKSDVAASVFYGKTFACGLQRRNIYGVQFHPEKSHRFGMDIFKKFAEL